MKIKISINFLSLLILLKLIPLLAFDCIVFANNLDLKYTSFIIILFTIVFFAIFLKSNYNSVPLLISRTSIIQIVFLFLFFQMNINNFFAPFENSSWIILYYSFNIIYVITLLYHRKRQQKNELEYLQIHFNKNIKTIKDIFYNTTNTLLMFLLLSQSLNLFFKLLNPNATYDRNYLYRFSLTFALVIVYKFIIYKNIDYILSRFKNYNNLVATYVSIIFAFNMLLSYDLNFFNIMASIVDLKVIVGSLIILISSLYFFKSSFSKINQENIAVSSMYIYIAVGLLYFLIEFYYQTHEVSYSFQYIYKYHFPFLLIISLVFIICNFLHLKRASSNISN